MILDHNTVLAEALDNAFHLQEYCSLIEKISTDDFKATPEFRKSFNAFFTVRQRKPSWYDCYYSLMEQQKTTPKSFEELLRILYAENHTIEVSFVSKMMAAVNPELPIWDRYVIQNLGFLNEWERFRQKPAEERTRKAVEIYDEIILRYQEFLASENGKLCVRCFDEAVPKYKNRISDVKKIDYWLWSRH